MTDHHLPPDAWRSEAFAEDLDDAAPAPAITAPRGALAAHLLSVLPVALATVGAAFSTWGSWA